MCKVSAYQKVIGSNSIWTLSRNRTETDTGTKWKVKYHVKMFTLIQDRNRDQDALCPIVPVLFHVQVPVAFTCSVDVP